MFGKHAREGDTYTDDTTTDDTYDDTRAVRHRDAVRVETVAADSGVVAARRRFGGFDLPAAFAGMLAALGLTVLLAGIAGAAGTIGYQRGASTGDLSSGGLITGLVVLLLSFFVGGWVAGRMARYDGVLNGTSAAVLFVLLAAGMSALGTWLGDKYDFFNNVRLPQWFTDLSSTTAVVSAVVGIVLVLLAAALGGAVGARYHRRADAVVLGDGAVTGMDRSEIVGRHAIR